VESLLERMGIEEEMQNAVQKTVHARILREKNQDKIRLSPEFAKKWRHEQKIFRDTRTGKENAKNSYKTDKMSPKRAETASRLEENARAPPTKLVESVV